MRGAQLLLSAFVLLSASTVAAAAADDTDLAARAAGQLKPLLSDYEVTEVDPLTLKIHKAGGEDMQINLDRIQKFCAANPDRCDAELGDFTTKVVAIVKANDAAAKPTASMLRIMVRQADYADEINRELAASHGRLVAAPIAAHLVMMCALDTPNAARPLLESDLKDLGMTADQAIAACKANSAHDLPEPVTEVQPLAPQSLGTLKEGYYTASQFALPERWEAVNSKLGGKLIVCVVSTDLMLYGREDSAVDVGALRQYAIQAAQTSERPISSDVYRWTKTGWQIAQE